MSTNDTTETDNNEPLRSRDTAAVQSLDEKRKEIERRERAEQAEQAKTAKTARKTLKEEPSPKEKLRAATKKTITKEFRGIDFTFEELGEDALRIESAASGDSVEDGSKAARIMYEVLGENCVGVDFEGMTGDEIGADFWAEYDLGGPDGDGVVNLYRRIMEESSDIDPEEAEKIKNSR